MKEASVSAYSSQEMWRWRALLFGLGFLAVYLLLGLFDNTTEIFPTHEAALDACFVVAGLLGVTAAGFVFALGRHAALWGRTCIASSAALFVFLAAFLLTERSTRLVEGLIDFPAARTRTHPALAIIGRAYRTHGKGQSWNIQTTPLWSNMDITQADYGFMLTHQPPAGVSRDGDEIHSEGYFCAKVMVQETGTALRVLHAGSERLPTGTVVICPRR